MFMEIDGIKKRNGSNFSLGGYCLVKLNVIETISFYLVTSE